MNFLKINLSFILFFICANQIFAQKNFDSTKYSPVVLDGKEAYLEIETGKIFYGDHTRSQVYEEQSTDLGQTQNLDVKTNSSSNQGQYQVVKGDTLYGIARKFGLKPAKLAQLNSMSLNAPLKIGQVLVVKLNSISQEPLQTPIISNNTNYRVVKGDTLYSIARTYGITVYELKQLNGLSGNFIYVNQTLRVR